MNKNLLFDKETTISFQERNASKLYIYYEGSELCFAIDNYDFNNAYVITHDSELYMPMKNLFKRLKKIDGMRYLTSCVYGDKFEWVSEGMGIPEIQNRLVIQEQKNKFMLSFIKNKYNVFDSKKMCSVHFAMINSKNKNVAQSFNELFINLYNKMKTDNSKKLLLK